MAPATDAGFGIEVNLRMSWIAVVVSCFDKTERCVFALRHLAQATAYKRGAAALHYHRTSHKANFFMIVTEKAYVVAGFVAGLLQAWTMPVHPYHQLIEWRNRMKIC